MQVPHNTYVLVADGRKMLFLRNEGDAVALDLKVEEAQEHPNPRDIDQKTDQAGRASSTRSGAGAPAVAQNGSNHARGGGAQFAPAGGTMGEADYHQLEEDRFAGEVADLLKRRALANEFESLIIIAPPRTLGELRKHYHKEVSDRLKGEIGKDLTGHPIPDIEAALLKA
ncbi:host attachment family protein [Sphingomonas sp.]|jgi:protein required for attachment to host cells|uniref:host attachment family protein n=1 Tax=Sphingomonas sp. TaxID=28214 RepID=UPI002ED999E5